MDYIWPKKETVKEKILIPISEYLANEEKFNKGHNYTA